MELPGSSPRAPARRVFTSESSGLDPDQALSDTRPTEHGGQKEDGGQDKRVSSEHGFGMSPYRHEYAQLTAGGDHEAAVEAGRKGGEASYENDGLTH